ncbi:dihydrofolate reductase [Occultella glacieicola]|uniref:Dihydrofolate reductase n=1 Tax=Occultella glacieicola TaxID=2518684 RepID=A0ABY2E065_9MICO|nr:dihydrofolate reductase family protein [Occultella glacieicola]TDE90795.1 dihydrofolate reductase [Occultella glacieicola]
MNDLIYSATMSADGYIAGPGGDMSWLGPFTGADTAADELAARTGALLVGNTTYGGDDPNEGTDAEGAFGGTWHGPQFVLTHRPPTTAAPDVTFTDDLEWAVGAARAAAGERDVNVLGADVARQCLELGLLDEVVVFVVPVLLGDGVRLFDRPGGRPVRLEHIARSTEAESTYLRMRVLKD